jgi:hypothetical protein
MRRIATIALLLVSLVSAGASRAEEAAQAPTIEAVSQERDAAVQERDAAKNHVVALQRSIENLLKQVGECTYARAAEAAAGR